MLIAPASAAMLFAEQEAFMLLLDENSLDVQHLMERDWRLRHLIEEIGPLNCAVKGSAFSHLAFSVIEQMLSMKAGRTIEARLIDACGGEITQEAIFALDRDTIRSCGIAKRKAQTLINLAQAMPEERLEALVNLSEDDVRATLMEIHGIGRWTADMYLIFYLCRPDVLPLEDGAVRQSFQWLYGAPIADANVQQAICSLWHPYASCAVRYLYAALNQGLIAQGSSEAVLGLS